MPAVLTLAGKLTAKQAPVALSPVMMAIASGPAPDEGLMLAPAVQALAGKLTAEQAPPAIMSVLKAIANTTDRAQLMGLSLALEAIATRLTAEQAQTALPLARSALAWSSAAVDATASARAITALAENQADERRILALVEALKYPSAAGEATDVLLDALHAAAPEAPGKEAGLEANLLWIANHYPMIDLDAPPSCPSPLQEGLACPGAAAK
jgi:hypothetical protein